MDWLDDIELENIIPAIVIGAAQVIKLRKTPQSTGRLEFQTRQS